MSLNISLKYILLILSSLLFILISISGMLFPLIKFDFIYQYNLSIYPIEERTSLPLDEIKNTNNKIAGKIIATNLISIAKAQNKDDKTIFLLLGLSINRNAK